MNRVVYKITGWALFVCTIYAFYNLLLLVIWPLYYYISLGSLNSESIHSIVYNLVFSIIIFSLSFFPGRAYLKIGQEKSKQNKLTNFAVILTLIWIVLIIIGLLSVLMICRNSLPCEGGAIFLFPLYLGSILHIVAVILLIINKFRR